jgi:hypothetical protein
VFSLFAVLYFDVFRMMKRTIHFKKILVFILVWSTTFKIYYQLYNSLWKGALHHSAQPGVIFRPPIRLSSCDKHGHPCDRVGASILVPAAGPGAARGDDARFGRRVAHGALAVHEPLSAARGACARDISP